MKKLLIIVSLTMLFFTSCVETTSYDAGQSSKEVVLQLAEQAVPVPQITNFLERANVARRAKTMDQPDKLFYVYIFNYGIREPIAYIVLQGKVSSLRSYMVPQERIQYGQVVQDADIDGTYGENIGGLFGYTVAGTYFETILPYMTFDTPIPIYNVPDITAAIDSTQKK